MTRIISGKMQECSWKMLLTAWWWWCWRRWRVRRPVSKPRPPPTPSLYSFFIVIVLLDLLTSGHHLLSRVLYIKSVLHHFSIVSWCILLLIIFINSSVFTPCCFFKRVPSPVYSFTLFKWLAKSCLSFSLSLSSLLFLFFLFGWFPIFLLPVASKQPLSQLPALKCLENQQQLQYTFDFEPTMNPLWVSEAFSDPSMKLLDEWKGNFFTSKATTCLEEEARLPSKV